MDSRIVLVLDFINDHLNDRLNLNQLAELACMSPSHFHKVFKQQTGLTPFKLVEQKRMKKAFEAIILGRTNVSELTRKLGYSEYESFTRAFKKHYTIAPDDLKSIVFKIKNHMLEEGGEMIIKIVDTDDEQALNETTKYLKSELDKLIDSNSFSKEDIEEGKVLSIEPKSDEDGNENNLVKNKFVIKENKELWLKFLNQP